LTDAKTQSSKPINCQVLVNKIKQQPNYNTNKLNDMYKLLTYTSKTKLTK